MHAALFPDLVVNGEKVPHPVVAAEAQNHEAPRGKPGLAWRKAANAVAVRTLLLQEARRRGIAAEQQPTGPGRIETEEEALVRTLLDNVVEVTAPGEDAIRAEWARDPSRFSSPPLWEVSHILCACDPSDEKAREEARARADVLTREALSRPKRFAALAGEHSECGSKNSGGALGQLGPGDTVPEFEAALRHLLEGEITAEPVLTRHGWHIIRMDAIDPGRELPYEAVRPKIAEAMEKVAWAQAARAFVAGLVETAEITGADLSKPVTLSRPAARN